MSAGRGVLAVFAAVALAAAGGLACLVAGVWDEPEAPVVAAPIAEEPARGAEPAPSVTRRPESVAPALPQTLSGEFRIAGRVINDDETPAAGATVRTMRAGSQVDEARTDAGGRFFVAAGERPGHGTVEIGIMATYGKVRAAWESFDLEPDTPGGADVGDIQLEPAVALIARVEDVGGPVPGAQVFVGSFFGTAFATAVTDKYGVARFETTPETDAWLFAYSKGRGRARGEIPDGRDPTVPLVLTLTARSVRVSVVEMPSGNPLAGERVGVRLVTPFEGRSLYSSVVPPLDLPATGDTGTIVVPDLGAEESVEFSRAEPATPRAAWRSAGPGASRAVAGPREIEARIDVRSGESLRWRIVPGDAAMPCDGDVVELKRGTRGSLPTGPGALRVEDGFLSGYGFATTAVRGIAVARDGSIARLAPGGDARFMRPRSVGVTVRDETGRGVAKRPVMLRAALGGYSDARETGDDGRAVFAGLEPDLGVLDVGVRTGESSQERWLASVDTARGDAEISVRVPREQAVLLRVTTSGERRRPAAWRLLVDTEWQSKAAEEGEDGIRFVATATARGAPIRVVLRAEGFLDGVAEVMPSADGAPVTAGVALETGATLFVEYRPPPGVVGMIGVFLMSWNPESASWETWRDRPNLAERKPGADGRHRFDAVPPGRYRVGAGTSYATSEPVDVVAGVAPPPLRLDLGKGGNVAVKLVDPDGAPAPGAWVAAGGTVDSGWSAHPRTDADREAGIARIFVPGDRTVRLVARHSMLRPDPEKGFADVRDAGGELTLHLAEGPVVTFSAPPPPGWRPPNAELAAQPGASIGMQVLVYPGGPAEGAAALSSWGMLAFADWKGRFGGIAPGRATFWIKLPWGAPVVVRDVDVGESAADLGLLRAPRGSSIRVRFDVPEGESAPRLSLSARRLTAPLQFVNVTGNGESEVEIPGLGPGRYEVLSTAMGRAGIPLRRLVDVDGERDVVIEASSR